MLEKLFTNHLPLVVVIAVVVGHWLVGDINLGHGVTHVTEGQWSVCNLKYGKLEVKNLTTKCDIILL